MIKLKSLISKMSIDDIQSNIKQLEKELKATPKVKLDVKGLKQKEMLLDGTMIYFTENIDILCKQHKIKTIKYRGYKIDLYDYLKHLIGLYLNGNKNTKRDVAVELLKLHYHLLYTFSE